MGNSTTWLTMPAFRLPIGTQVGVIGKCVDFTVESLASGSSIDVIKLPKGCVPLIAGWVTHTTDAQNPTFALTLGTATTSLVSATAIGAVNAVVMTHITASAVVSASDYDTLRVTGGAATCDDGKVTFFVVVYQNEQGSPS